MSQKVDGGFYFSVGGSTASISFGSSGVSLGIGGQLSAVYTVSGSTTLSYHPDSGFSFSPAVMDGVGTPTGLPGMTFSWLSDPSGSGIQQIQVGAGINDIIEIGADSSPT